MIRRGLKRGKDKKWGIIDGIDLALISLLGALDLSPVEIPCMPNQ